MIIGRDFAEELNERYFSEYDEDITVDDVYEKAFSDGVEYACKMFGIDSDDDGEKVEDPDDLNISDKISNFLDKNPLSIKKLREDRLEHLSKKKGKGRVTSLMRSLGAGTAAAGLAGMAGNPAAGLIGMGTIAGTYGADRVGRRVRNAIRKHKGGGEIDDRYAREADRLKMLDGKMSKHDFKKKWYRNNDAY